MPRMSYMDVLVRVPRNKHRRRSPARLNDQGATSNRRTASQFRSEERQRTHESRTIDISWSPDENLHPHP
jgi:hypothetical protein